MTTINICSVVTGETLDEFMKNLDDIQKVSDFVEIRADYISELKISDIVTIHSKLKGKAIFTCRNEKDGGKFIGSEEKQQKFLQRANDLGFDFIDIDLRIFNQIKLKNKKSEIIISYHNFDRTPEYIDLIGILDEMRASGADVFKFATMVENDDDIQTIYKLILSKKKDEKIIAVGMGEKGRITRILSPLLGGYLTFASVGKSASAPGQVDIEELRGIYSNLDVGIFYGSA